MRVLFLSDTHLGFDLPARPRVARTRRGPDFFASFERALAPAFAGEVDVLVHGGDLLYRSRVPLSLADAALEPLRRVASSGIPVVLVPGNHERARMPYPLLALHDGLHLVDRPRAIVVEQGGVRAAFLGFPYTRGIRQAFSALLSAARRHAPAADVTVLCLHHCIEGSTCGPGHFVFRSGPEVIRAADLPRDVAVTLCGHIHRHQVLHPPGTAPVIYSGSTERTSFAEASETKGYVIVDLSRRGLESFAFTPLPVRPMVTCPVGLDGLDRAGACARVAAALAATPADAVVRVMVTGAVPAGLDAATLRALGGTRVVTWRVLGYPVGVPFS